MVGSGATICQVGWLTTSAVGGTGSVGAGATGTTGSGSRTTGSGVGAAATGSGAVSVVSAGSAADEITSAATTASATSTGASCVRSYDAISASRLWPGRKRLSSPVVWLAILSSRVRSAPAGSGVAASAMTAAVPSAANRAAASRAPSSTAAAGSTTGSGGAATGSGAGTTTGAGGVGGATSATGLARRERPPARPRDRLGRATRLPARRRGSGSATTGAAATRLGRDRLGRDRHRLLDDRLDLDRCLFDDCLDRLGLGLGRRGRLRLRDRRRVGQCGQRSQARREVEARFGVMRQAVGLMPAIAAVAVLAVDRLGGDRFGEVGARRRQVRERRGHDLVTEMRGAGQAARLGLVPAVRAGVLPALHAEVEGLVEGVELVGGGLALGLAPRGGHRLVHRRVIGQDEVLQPARHDLDALQPGLRTRGLERVTSPTTFAE